jgi:hypothetical protein
VVAAAETMVDLHPVGDDTERFECFSLGGDILLISEAPCVSNFDATHDFLLG